ncbi:L-threonylcarbamoyladenylate synthase [Marinilactibacillus sp. Marseille-P9653]|uniref:L-threonylcarbamoyladenylate synthase n=1 Tax=Marinilactibacillus sp. Marseille-P9653 TaxID=2866583 RepID=UPI001CE44011|nr:L-threonylcarbamoyladenylate synthase [Marinilactibacillus sp. Marseille-P9653]
METIWIKEQELEKAVQLLLEGEVVTFPTETVYGLGADATNEEAVKKIYEAKGRPADNPLIIHVSSIEQAYEYAEEIPKAAQKIMEAFWPGPCTIVLKKKGPIAQTVTAGLGTVGIRMPNHPIALQLIKDTGKPLAAPSANSSGKPSPTSAQHVYRDLNGKIAGIVEGGETGVGLESTVLDLSNPKSPTILRPGGISRSEIEAVIGPVRFNPGLVKESDAPVAPGMKYTHYSPTEPVIIISEKGIGWEKAIKQYQLDGEVVGILASEETIKQFGTKETVMFSLGEKSDVISASRRLFKGLRFFEETKATIILAEPFNRSGIGEAYMNRLEKAAAYSVI